MIKRAFGKIFTTPLVQGEFQVLPHRPVPDYIRKPFYYETQGIGNFSDVSNQNIQIYDEYVVSNLRLANKIAAGALKSALDKLQEGMTGEDLDIIIHDYIINQNAYPAAIYYQGFPKSVCVSVNEIVCHGIPSLRPFKTGDYVNFDVTTYINGVYGDTSAMATVGKVPDEVDDIITTTYDCLYKAIDICEPGVKINKIGEIIENHAKTKGFTVCREFIGHGIGIEMHMAPPVVHNSNLYIGNNEESIMRPGMVFTIEPILIMNKDYRLGIWQDGWTIQDITYSPSAQWEHSLLITENGCEILSDRSNLNT